MREGDFAVVQQRSGNSCEICGVRAENVHHRKPRGMGGAGGGDGAENLLNLCGSGTQGCHGWIEHNRAVAVGQGWLVQGDVEPAEVPVAYRGRWCWLTEAGVVIPLSGGEAMQREAPRRLLRGALRPLGGWM